MKFRQITLTTIFSLLPFLTGTAFAAGDEENLTKLGSFKTTGTTGGQSIAQEGKYADNLRKVLKTIKMQRPPKTLLWKQPLLQVRVARW